MTAPAPYPAFDGTQRCIGLGDTVMFPRSPADPPPAAKQACSTCRFLRPCLAYALTHTVSGVWGGTTEPERVEIRRQHGIRAEPLKGFSNPTWTDHIDALTASGLRPAEIAAELGMELTSVQHHISGANARYAAAHRAT